MDERIIEIIKDRITLVEETVIERKCVYHLGEGTKVCSNGTCRRSMDDPPCHKAEEFHSEVPSKLFDGLTFLPYLGTVQYKDKIMDKCPALQLRLLEFLDANGGTVDLSHAARECWGKELDESSTEEDEKTVPLKTVRRAFYKIESLFEQVELPATVMVSTTDGIAKIESRLFD